jgi:hypothetical protein
MVFGVYNAAAQLPVRGGGRRKRRFQGEGHLPSVLAASGGGIVGPETSKPQSICSKRTISARTCP